MAGTLSVVGDGYRELSVQRDVGLGTAGIGATRPPTTAILPLGKNVRSGADGAHESTVAMRLCDVPCHR